MCITYSTIHFYLCNMYFPCRTIFLTHSYWTYSSIVLLDGNRMTYVTRIVATLRWRQPVYTLYIPRKSRGLVMLTNSLMGAILMLIFVLLGLLQRSKMRELKGVSCSQKCIPVTKRAPMRAPMRHVRIFIRCINRQMCCICRWQEPTCGVPCSVWVDG